MRDAFRQKRRFLGSCQCYTGSGAGSSGVIGVVGILRVNTSGGINWVACVGPGFETPSGLLTAAIEWLRLGLGG